MNEFTSIWNFKTGRFEQVDLDLLNAFELTAYLPADDWIQLFYLECLKNRITPIRALRMCMLAYLSDKDTADD